MENLTSEDKRARFAWELKDLLAGTAFPLMIMLIFSASIISYAGYGNDAAIEILCIVVGEILLFAAYFIFGRQSGVTAYRKYVLNSKKRQMGSPDKKALYKTGEYAVWKAVIIGLISCLPFIIFQFINCCYENTVCTFALSYCFGWAYYPLYFADLSEWLNFIWIIPLVAMHTAAYIVGKNQEEKKVKIIEEAQRKVKKKK